MNSGSDVGKRNIEETKETFQHNLAELTQETDSSNLKNVLLNKLKRNQQASYLLLQIVSIVLFNLASPLASSFPFTIIAAGSGLLGLIILPGGLLVRLTLPENTRNIGTSFIMGLVLIILEIQALFSLFLVIEPLWNLAILLSISSSLLCIGLLFILTSKSMNANLFTVFSLGEHRSISRVLLVALIIRIGMLVIAQGSIAPDAALYADYARNMLDLQFHSSIANDHAVIDLWSDMQYIDHQAFSYFFAVSLLLFPYTTSGPTFILAILGTVLILPCHTIARHYFEERTARFVAIILAATPILVFHSSVGYGPEISSLVLMMFSASFLIYGFRSNSKSVLIPGVLIGLVDAIWMPNFYITCIVLPLALGALEVLRWREAYAMGVLMVMTLATRVFVTSVFLFASLWITIFAILYLIGKATNTPNLAKLYPFFLGILVIMVFQYWPLQIAQIINTLNATTTSALQISSSSFPIITVELLLRFTSFAIFHLTPVISVLAIVSLRKGKPKRVVHAFALGGLIACTGTLLVFGLFDKDVLLLIYLFSDSRFFIFITLMGVFVAAGFMNVWLQTIEQHHEISEKKSKSVDRKGMILLAIIFLGFLPGYAAFPAGLDFTNIETRYGWNYLPEVVAGVGNQDSLFLVDRAREFAWLTERKSVVMDFSQIGLSNIGASLEIEALLANFDADYLIMDGYTVAHWKTLDYFLYSPLAIHSSMILDTQHLIDLDSQNSTGEISSLRLEAATEPNLYGRYARIYSLDISEFSKIQSIELDDIGWTASNNGTITNSTDGYILTIGQGASYTNTWREDGFDLELSINSGFVLFEVETTTASLARIEVWDGTGEFLAYAEKISDNLYACPVGEVVIGDIRFVIEGNQGDYVRIESISVWEIS